MSDTRTWVQTKEGWKEVHKEAIGLRSLFEWSSKRRKETVQKKNNKKKGQKDFPPKRGKPKQKQRSFKILPPPKWFICGEGHKVEQSPAEQRIHQALNSLGVEFHNEVSFYGFRTGEFYYRFDFYLPSLNTMIEYDGEHHKEAKVRYNDRVKNDFCKRHGIRIKRFNKKNWDTLEMDILKFIRK